MVNRRIAKLFKNAAFGFTLRVAMKNNNISTILTLVSTLAELQSYHFTRHVGILICCVLVFSKSEKDFSNRKSFCFRFYGG
jgi:hypothetical protein